MKRIINIFLILSICLLTLSAKAAVKNYCVSDLIKVWKAKTIKVNAPNPNITDFFKDFAKVYPGYSVNNTILRMNTGKSKLLSQYILDVKNGYLSSTMPETGVDNILQMCYWNKADGHKLIAIYMSDFEEGDLFDADSGNFNVLMFFDFDATTHTMTPLPTPPADKIPFGLTCVVTLPRTGKDIKFEQSAGEGDAMENSTMYLRWNGNAFTCDGTESEHHKLLRRNDCRNYWAEAGLENLWADSIAEEENTKPEQFAFIDIDGDGDEEIFLRDTKNSLGCVLSYGANVRIVARENSKNRIALFGNFVTVSGAAGSGGAVYTEYHQFEGNEVIASCSTLSFTDSAGKRVTEYNGDNHNAKIESEAKAIIAKVPKKSVDLSRLNWMPFSKLATFAYQ
jgi:hypothetical protein